MMKKNGQVSSGKTDFILSFNVVNLVELVSGERYRNYLINNTLYDFSIFNFPPLSGKIYNGNSQNFF